VRASFKVVAVAAAVSVPLALHPLPAPAAQPAPGAVGINLANYLNEAATEIVFVDVFRQASPWRFGPKWVDPKAPVPADPGASVIGPDGWVKSLRYDQQAYARVFTGGDGHYPGGVYKVLYEGQGEIVFYNANTIVGRKPGEIDLAVTPTAGPTSGIVLVIQKTDPSDPIRNIRMILPGYEDADKTRPFYPPFLRTLKPFNTLRFMAWQLSNYDTQREWSDRRAPTYATQASAATWTPGPDVKGVSYEDIIALANELNENPWVSVPTFASDDYIRRMARLFHETLKPTLHPMVEYSNEIWNAGFALSFCHMREQAIALRLTGNPGAPCARDDQGRPVAPPDAWSAHGQWYYYALRLSQIFDIWNAEYGADKDRIVHVVAEWAADPREIETVLSYGQSVNGLAGKADVIATAGYVAPLSRWSKAYKSGRLTWAQVAGMSPGDVIRAMNESIDAELAPQFRAARARAQKWGLGLAVYEGGDGNEAGAVSGPEQDAIAALYAATARDPGMAQVYTHLLDAWKASGGSLFNQFYDVGGYGRFGQWGALEYQDQDPATSPKYTALGDWIRSHGK